MEKDLKRKFILIKRKTRLDELVARFNTVNQAKFYIEHMGSDFKDYKDEHDRYNLSVRSSAEILERFGQVQVLDRSFVPNFIFGPDDIVVAVGQDGLVANTLKYLGSQQLIGINPDPDRWDGILLPFVVKDLEKIASEALEGKRKSRMVTLAQAELNDGQTLLAVNDIFIGHSTHVSARYEIKLGAKKEKQSSSGIIISTGLGSSAWFKSLVKGAYMITKGIYDVKFPENPKLDFPWDADYLYYTVREPFTSKTSAASLVFGKIDSRSGFTITSLMPEDGVIFSDGIEDDFIKFNSGIKVTIKLAGIKRRLVV
jgi:NAD kinase